MFTLSLTTRPLPAAVTVTVDPERVKEVILTPAAGTFAVIAPVELAGDAGETPTV